MPKLKRVTIKPTAGTLGHCRHFSTPAFRPDVDSTPRTLVRIQEEIVALLAGAAAEKRFAGRAHHRAAASDYDAAADLALRLVASSRSANALLKWLGIVSEDLVEFRWREIVAVAHELLERGMLNSKAVRRTIIGIHPTRYQPPSRSRPR